MSIITMGIIASTLDRLTAGALPMLFLKSVSEKFYFIMKVDELLKSQN